MEAMVCTCGHGRCEHDTDTDPIDQPCLFAGCPCDNFYEED